MQCSVRVSDHAGICLGLVFLNEVECVWFPVSVCKITVIRSMEGSSQAAVAPDFDVYGAMDWQDGVGTLPGSQLKVTRLRYWLTASLYVAIQYNSLCVCVFQFRVNEFGVLEVVTDEVKEEAEEEEEGVRKAHATTTWVVPSSHDGENTCCSSLYLMSHLQVSTLDNL